MLKNVKNKKSSSSSSSDSEEDDVITRQIKEAAVSFETINASIKVPNNSKSSKRSQEVVNEDDFNSELTPEFQDFVAKKLKAKIDE